MPDVMIHPRDALHDAGDAATVLPVCDHYAGIEARMKKSLELQAQLGPVFDITLDCEDGAPVGGEAEHAHLVAETLMSDANRFGRVGARVHPVDHPAFVDDVTTLVSRAGGRLAYLMVPKLRDAADLTLACGHIDHLVRVSASARHFPIHVLVETPGALREVDAIAAHPRVESLSFGLMDFVSAHRGAIPATAMSAAGQFSHPLVVRAKLEIAAACHTHGKTPSHCVVTEFADKNAIANAAQKASRELGYTRMWSIHPSQIPVIVETFRPAASEVEEASEILLSAQAADWAPIRHRDTLHDRASYRYFWHVLQRAHSTGQTLPEIAERAFFDKASTA